LDLVDCGPVNAIRRSKLLIAFKEDSMKCFCKNLRHLFAAITIFTVFFSQYLYADVGICSDEKVRVMRDQGKTIREIKLSCTRRELRDRVEEEIQARGKNSTEAEVCPSCLAQQQENENVRSLKEAVTNEMWCPGVDANGKVSPGVWFRCDPKKQYGPRKF
jgi:hypothetical protein